LLETPLKAAPFQAPDRKAKVIFDFILPTWSVGNLWRVSLAPRNFKSDGAPALQADFLNGFQLWT